MSEMQNYVILVDEFDAEIGVCEKLEAHSNGLLHRAFSVLLYNSKGELLLQQRAATKYHSAGLWSNACCSHPAPNESILAAANRRLYEELFLTEIELTPLFHFNYIIQFENGLYENEIDHVLVGKWEQLPIINPEEAMNYAWKSFDEIKLELKEKPELYTYWFKHIIEEFESEVKNGMYENLQERNV